MQRQTDDYLPSHMASIPCGWYQIILFDDRDTCVNNLYKVVNRQWNGRKSNQRPQCLNNYNVGLTYGERLHW